MKVINKRCPLQAECERKCEYEGHELDCRYYADNGVGEDRTIPDQEAIRQERERENFELGFDLLDDDEDKNDENDEEKTGHFATPGKMVYLPIDLLHPHPDNPRKQLGDLTELADSIKANGVFQNLTVVPDDTGYTIIIGHRRHAASQLAGLTELPCVIAAMTPKEQLSTMLLENMQRSDLTVYEQAQGFQMMLDLGSTVEEIADKSGFSKATVRRRVKMMELDQPTLKEVSERQLSLADFDKLAQIEDISKRNSVLKSIGTNNFASEFQSAIRKQEISRNLPAAKELVKQLKASKINPSDTYGSSYQKLGSTITLWDWDGKSHPTPKDQKAKLYYTLEPNYGELKFFVKSPKAKPVKRPQEEIDREKRMAEANAEMTRLNELHYELRKSFVDGLTVGKNNQLAMLQAAVLTCAGSAICYTGSNRNEVTGILQITDSYACDRGKKMVEAFDKVDPSDYPKLIYHGLGDSVNRSFGTSYKGQFPKFQHCDELEIVYTWLLWVGYEMSDDEIALRNGTHEIFSRK